MQGWGELVNTDAGLQKTGNLAEAESGRPEEATRRAINSTSVNDQAKQDQHEVVQGYVALTR